MVKAFIIYCWGYDEFITTKWNVQMYKIFFTSSIKSWQRESESNGGRYSNVLITNFLLMIWKWICFHNQREINNKVKLNIVFYNKFHAHGCTHNLKVMNNLSIQSISISKYLSVKLSSCNKSKRLSRHVINILELFYELL